MDSQLRATGISPYQPTPISLSEAHLFRKVCLRLGKTAEWLCANELRETRLSAEAKQAQKSDSEMAQDDRILNESQLVP